MTLVRLGLVNLEHLSARQYDELCTYTLALAKKAKMKEGSNS